MSECKVCGKRDLLIKDYCSNECAVIDLRAQLEAAEKDRDTAQRMLGLANKALENAGSAARFTGKMIKIPIDAIVFSDNADDIESRLDIENEPAYSQKQWRELEQERDNLQAQVGVLRGALETWESIYGEAYCQIGYCKCGNTMPSISHKMCKGCAIKLTRQALSTTPAEAGERVRGLVEALEAVQVHFCQHINTVGQCPKCGEVMAHSDEPQCRLCLSQQINDALAKYRGGADGVS